MQGFPQDSAVDATWTLWREGYGFASRRCSRLGTDAFRTRLMLRPALCVRGAAAAEMFYDPDRFTRRGAMPAITLRLLQDKGSVQLLDGAEHRHRKSMFADILTDDAQIARLGEAVRAELEAALPGWERRGTVELVEAMVEVLTRAGCRWAGVPTDERPARQLARELGGMVENAGRAGPSAWLALAARARHERYIRGVVRRIRAGSLALPADAPARIVAEHRDLRGRPLDERDAAVELVNLTRPIVAVAWFVGFAVLALERHAGWRDRLRSGESWLEPFVEEVRRLYPFFPMVGGRARATFEWRGEAIPEGAWVLLDLYGTNHDPQSFPEPFRFSPERRLTWRDQGYAFIPQGGGPVRETHRCPGECATVEIMKAAAAFFARSLAYRLRPTGELSLTRYPATPDGGYVLEGVGRERS